MASELIVQTLRGPASGANANKIIVPSGQTLDASAGFVPPAGAVVQVATSNKTIGNAGSGADLGSVTISVTGGYSTAYVLHSIAFTPKYSTSLVLLQLSCAAQIGSSGACGINTFFGKDGSNILSSGGSSDCIMFTYSSNAISDEYRSISAQWAFTAGQTAQMILDARISSYSSGTPGTIHLQHDGTTSFSIMEIAQ